MRNRKERMKIIRFREDWDTIKCIKICVEYQKGERDRKNIQRNND